MQRAKKLRRMLDRTVDRIIQSYNRHGGINHIKGPTLPARSEITGTLESLVSIIFPGFFDTSDINPANLKYHVGAKCEAVYQQLVDQINKCFRYVCRNERRCRPESLRCEFMKEKACLVRAREITRALLQQLPEIRKTLYADVHAAFVGDPAAKSLDEIILAYPGLAAITVYRIAHVLWMKKVPLLPRIMTEHAHARTGIDIHPGAVIGKHFMIDHGTGVVIGETTEIGKHVRIYQGVPLGALSVPHHVEAFRWKKRHPTIEDNVTIYSGATILGGKTVIGRGAVIGGNVWITKSVPPFTRVMFEPPAMTMQRRVAQPAAGRKRAKKRRS
ncbi:MAG: serine acetyltransferase [Candidatus Aureabacteria bacterium]|nr:serine acetyltransferase [Candidatus Auribacterota bacterium]